MLIKLNIFEGLFKNWMFLVIVLVIIVLQVVLVTFGSLAFGVYKYYGLSIYHWLICVIRLIFRLESEFSVPP